MPRRTVLALLALTLALPAQTFTASAFAPALQSLAFPSSHRSVHLRATQQGEQGTESQAGRELDLHLSRRSFLQGVGIVGAAIGCFPQAALADADNDRIRAGAISVLPLVQI